MTLGKPIRPRAIRPLLCALVLVLLGTGASAAAAPQAEGGEPFFPHAGSHDYNALNYRVRLVYSRQGRIKAVMSMRARARTRLHTVKLDLDGLTVSQVKVDGGGERFSRGHEKLIVHLLDPIPAGERFKLTVFYAGRPRTVVDPDGSSEGWYPTADGVVAVGEPEGTAAWLPCNNIPADKATFEAELIVPNGLTAVSNGRLTGVDREPGRRAFSWVEDSPMSTYLAVVDIGPGKLVHAPVAGHPGWTLVDPKLAAHSRKALSHLPGIIRFESKLYGPYPFDAAGSIVADAPGLGYALETQDRPIYAFAPDLTTVVHETAHQWFGDSVGLKRWPDIWLNEGFATWTEWYYAERHGGRSAAATFHRLMQVPASNRHLWKPPTGQPNTPAQLFGPPVYMRGAMTLQALRQKVGTKAMLTTLRRWATSHRHGSGDTTEFIALAEKVSGQNLGPFFQRWLFTPGKP
ncbi:MAG: M1 family metallopeptidase [Actinobacteria bacterium]|nr:M1 family metallopeptidase [Actinomycetota bacterium]